MERPFPETAVLGVPGAGRRTLLTVLEAPAALPENLRLCVLDASRTDAPELPALLDALAARPELHPIFVLNKADLPVTVRSAVTRTLAMLRERGFAQPELYPLCAEAARLFLLPTMGRELTEADQTALAAAYDRFCPGENSLSAYAVSSEVRCLVGGREVSPEQLRLALENTGLPALRARLEELSAQRPARPAVFVPAEAPAPAPAPESEPEPTPEPVYIPPQAPADAELRDLPAPTADPEQWFDAIDRTEWEDLPAMEATLRRLPVNEQQSAELLAALNRRRWALQEQQMADMIAEADRESCAGLLRLAQRVRESDYPDAIRENALKALHARYQARELTELRELTLDADSLDIPALQALVTRIETGPYSSQTRAPYVELLKGLMDSLHRQALSEICRDVETADRPALDAMRELIGGRECSDQVKEPFLKQLLRREDALDLQKLEEVTAGCETMDAEALDELAETLAAESWNPRFITRFRHKVALCREAAVYRAVQAEAADVGKMERGEVLELQKSLQQKDLPGRFTAEPLARADSRLYRLDMLRLMAMENNFDRLGFDEMDALRRRVLQGDYHEQARYDYLSRIQDREHTLIYANAAAHAALVQQVAAQFKLKLSDFDLSSTAEDYDAKLKRFWGGTGLEQPRDIPVFLLDNASTLAFSGSRFWYKNGRDLAFLPLDEIDHFQGFKQMLSMTLQVVRKDNSYLLTEAKIFRLGASSVLDFLNECLRRWPERALPEGQLPAGAKTPAFLPAEYTAAPEVTLLNEQTVLQTLQAKFAAEKLKDGVLFGADKEGWENKTKKLLQNFELSDRTALVWYYAPSLLGSMKEGVAVGPGGIYAKQSKQPVVIIPMDEICSLERTGGKQAEVLTVSGQVRTLELPGAVIPALQDYIRGIQLCAQLRKPPQTAEEPKSAEEPKTPEEPKAPALEAAEEPKAEEAPDDAEA